MRIAIAPGSAVHWLFRSHDLPSKFSAVAIRMCGTRNRAVKHMHVRPAVLLVPNLFYRGNTWSIQIWKCSCYCMQINCLSSELSFLNYRNRKQECSVFYSFVVVAFHCIQKNCRLQTWCVACIKDEVTTLANQEANADLDHGALRDHTGVSADKLYAPWIEGFRLQGGDVDRSIGLGLGLIQS